MRELYGATETVFRGGRDVGRGRRGAPAPGGASPTTPASPWSRPIRRPAAWATAMEDAYFAAFSADEQMRPRRAWRARGRRRRAARRPRPRSAPTATPPRSWSPPRTGAACSPTSPWRSPASAATWSARASSPPARGEALDVFYVQDAAGAAVRRRQPARAGAAWSRRWSAAALRRGRRRWSRAAPADLGRAAAFAIAPGGDHRQRRLGRRHGGRGLGPRPAGPAGGARPHPGRGRSCRSSRPTSTTTASGRSTPSMWSPGPAGSWPTPHRPPPSGPACSRRSMTPSCAAARPRLERARASARR